jgi:hypothetical protein
LDTRNSSDVSARQSKTGSMSGAPHRSSPGTNGTRNLTKRRDGSKKLANFFKKRSSIEIKIMTK